MWKVITYLHIIENENSTPQTREFYILICSVGGSNFHVTFNTAEDLNNLLIQDAKEYPKQVFDPNIFNVPFIDKKDLEYLTLKWLV